MSVEALMESLAREVDEAADRVRVVVKRQPRWINRHLQETVNRKGQWTGSVVSLAVWKLVDEGAIVVDDDLTLRPAPVQADAESTTATPQAEATAGARIQNQPVQAPRRETG